MYLCNKCIFYVHYFIIYLFISITLFIIFSKAHLGYKFLNYFLFTDCFYVFVFSAEKANEDEEEDFKMEINFMKTIGRHENVVTMLGCCTLYPPLCLVVEYVPHGDLLHYLRNLRKTVCSFQSLTSFKFELPEVIMNRLFYGFFFVVFYCDLSAKIRQQGMKVLLKISKVAEFVGDLWKFNLRYGSSKSRKARFRCRSTHVPNLTDELSTAKERLLNQFGTPVFSNLVRKKR